MSANRERIADAKIERRNRWFRIAVELGQQDDFVAMLAEVKAEALQEAAEVLNNPDFDLPGEPVGPVPIIRWLYERADDLEGN